MPPCRMGLPGERITQFVSYDDVFPDGLSATVICSDQDLHQNELHQERVAAAIESLISGGNNPSSRAKVSPGDLVCMVPMQK